MSFSATAGTVRMRPVRAEDEPAVLALYERLSDESVYLRFFSPVPRPTAVQLERLTSIDYHDRMVDGRRARRRDRRHRAVRPIG